MFLEGRTDEIARDLRRDMQTASENLEFERAARLRDQVQAIERTTERQVMEVRDRTDMDVFGLARQEQEAYVQVFFVRKGLIIGRDIFQLDGAAGETDAEVLRSFVEQFYESAAFIPARVVLPVRIDDADLIQQWLGERRARPVQVMVPQRGEKLQLLQRAMDNARESLQQARARWMADRGKKDQALQQLQDELELPSLPRRIECYDISNIQGTSAVGSMVVFEDGNPKRSEYRRFRIKGLGGQNDFAMMQEVLKRRFWRARRQTEQDGANETEPEILGRSGFSLTDGATPPQTAADVLPDRDSAQPDPSRRTEGEAPQPRPDTDDSFGKMPDLLIVDGGKGQVSAAHDAMRNLGVGNIPLAGLAKRFEELYVKDVSEPIVLDRTSQALYLVQRVRDEAHRFAITYHRDVRKKSGLRSALDDVPGVGPKRKKALLRKFGSVRAIKDATVEEIAATPGFTRTVAEKVLEGL